jgi:hypothetical protein
LQQAHQQQQAREQQQARQVTAGTPTTAGRLSSTCQKHESCNQKYDKINIEENSKYASIKYLATFTSIFLAK